MSCGRYDLVGVCSSFLAHFFDTNCSSSRRRRFVSRWAAEVVELVADVLPLLVFLAGLLAFLFFLSFVFKE